MSTQNRISIICTCFNQEPFILDALKSVENLDYQNKELIIIDNASSDKSMELIRQFSLGKPWVKVISNRENLGICKAFNQGFKFSKGELIVDLSGDDSLNPNEFKASINFINSTTENTGVFYSNAILLNEYGQEIGKHYPDTVDLPKPPEGDIFDQVLRKYFICPPTMIIKREVIVALGGYDESLSFEDFDFWIRSSRDFNYGYIDELSINKRIHPKGLSNSLAMPEHLETILKVCIKAKGILKSKKEQEAFDQRISYQIRECIRLNEINIGFRFKELLISVIRRKQFQIALKNPGLSRPILRLGKRIKRNL